MRYGKLLPSLGVSLLLLVSTLAMGDEYKSKPNSTGSMHRATEERAASVTTEQDRFGLYLDMLAHYAEDFDPSYDQDIELDARRGNAFLKRGGATNPKAYIPFSEVERWHPTNSIQVAIWQTIEKAAQTYASMHRGDSKVQLPKPSLPPDLARALQYETAFCLITNSLAPFDDSMHRAVFSAMRDELVAKDDNANPALHLRYLRNILAMPILWSEKHEETISDIVVHESTSSSSSYSYVTTPSAAKAMENVRGEFVQRLFETKCVFSNQVACCRIANAAGMFDAVEKRVNKLADDKRKETNAGTNVIDAIEIARSTFARGFSFTRMFCWNSLRQSGYLAVVRDGKAARRAFIREIAALAHVGMDEAREMDRFYEFKTYEALGKMDE